MEISIHSLLEGAKRATDPKPNKETVDPKTANSGATALHKRQAGASIPAHIFWQASCI
jgi:hypothetical protein